MHLVLTSPPYPLARQRDYGGPERSEYVDWLCTCLEPVVARLAPGASLFLNVSNDIFEAGSPARSLYRERLVLALHERLGLSKMDEWVWHNASKAPGPVQWASKRRVQVNTAWADNYPEVTPEHKAKLQALLEQWLAECPSPRFYQVTDATPYVLTADDVTKEQLEEIALQEEDDQRAAQAAQGEQS